jgi:hypothetical protein
MSERGFPNNCPYCGDVDLWPHEAESPEGATASAGHGEWECRSCLRAFRLKMLGMVRPATTEPTTDPATDRAARAGGAR